MQSGYIPISVIVVVKLLHWILQSEKNAEKKNLKFH